MCRPYFLSKLARSKVNKHMSPFYEVIILGKMWLSKGQSYSLVNVSWSMAAFNVPCDPSIYAFTHKYTFLESRKGVLFPNSEFPFHSIYLFVFLGRRDSLVTPFVKPLFSLKTLEMKSSTCAGGYLEVWIYTFLT